MKCNLSRKVDAGSSIAPLVAGLKKDVQSLIGEVRTMIYVLTLLLTVFLVC